MNNIQIFLKEFFDTIKRDFIIILTLNLFFGILFRVHAFNELLVGVVIFGLFLKTVAFIKSASIMPSVSSDFDKYSWKYYQGLPLNKEELVISLVISNVLITSTLLIWLMCFLIPIATLFDIPTSVLEFSSISKIFIAFFPVMTCISFSTLKTQIIFPRKQYSKNDKKEAFYNSLKSIAVGVAVVVYGILLCAFLKEYIGKEISIIFKFSLQALGYILSTWLFVPVLLYAAYSTYQETLESWQNEKIGYVKLNWVPKRDIPITVSCILAVVGPLMLIDFSTPSIYQGTKLNKAVYNKDYKEIQKLISQGADINKKNEQGISPVMIAIHEGDFKMYRHLKDKGAKLDGRINAKADKYHDGMDLFMAAVDGGNISIIHDVYSLGFSVNLMNPKTKMYPIHVASKHCKTELVDFLIEKKADIKVLDADGKSALHYAAKHKCFASVATLIENGIDPDVKDKSGKLAIDYIPDMKNNLELVYYVTKKSRAPASKK